MIVRGEVEEMGQGDEVDLWWRWYRWGVVEVLGLKWREMGVYGGARRQLGRWRVVWG